MLQHLSEPAPCALQGASLRHAVRKGLLADVRDIIRNAGPNAYSLVQDAEPPKFKMGRTVRPAWNDASEEGFSAVHVAAKHNHIDILQLLLEVNPEALNSEVARGYKDRQVKQGLTPLMVAAGNGQARAVKELASRHAAVNDTLENGNTALLLAAAKGHCAALKELLKLPKPLAVDLDTKDHNGTLPCRLSLPVCCSLGGCLACRRAGARAMGVNDDAALNALRL